MSWIAMLTWQDQYRRMHHSFDRIPKEAILDDQTIADFFDAWYRFFMNVSHLRDWVGNDPSTSFPDETAVKQEIGTQSQYRHILICAHVANRAKHLGLNTPSKARRWEFIAGVPFEGAEISFASFSYPMSDEELDALGRARKLSTLTIVDPKTGEEYDAWLVARKALEEWDQFLSDHGLQPPSVSD